MGELVDLNEYRSKTAENRIFGGWQRRFNETYALDTRLMDLSDRTLYLLATPGEASNGAFYDVIMGVLDAGNAEDFTVLDRETQMQIVDIHLMLADQVRFELLRRLGWVHDLPSAGYSLVDMIEQATRLKTDFRGHPPQLAASHPQYAAYQNMVDRDKEGLIRKLLMEGLDEFKKRFNH